MKKGGRISAIQLAKIKNELTSLPYPLYIEREGKGPVKIFDKEGNFIQLPSYVQLPALLYFIKKNCPHDKQA